MAGQETSLPWDKIDETNLLMAVQHYGFGKWEQVAEYIDGKKNPSEAESHFKKRYPQSPTHPVLLPYSPLRQYADARRPVAEGMVSAARWIVKWHTKREFPDGYIPEVNVPASLAPKDVKKYEDDKKYVGDYVTVTAVYWFITTKIENDFVEARIPVWQLPDSVSVWDC